jgi:broad specificity phosphatase PhoE
MLLAFLIHKDVMMSHTEKLPLPSGGLAKVFIRHALSVNNERYKTATPQTDRVGGYQPRIELAAKGRQQAIRLGKSLLQNLGQVLDGHDFEIVRFASAPAVRTLDTARLAYAEAGLTAPFVIRPDLHELRKGNRWLGGDEKRLRTTVETPATHARRLREDWDFRHGRSWLGAIGLATLSGAETPREAGTRVKQWIDEVPPVDETLLESGKIVVDIAVSHGLAGRYGLALAMHHNDGTPGLTVADADKRYASIPNASATVLTRHSDDSEWTWKGRIETPLE